MVSLGNKVRMSALVLGTLMGATALTTLSPAFVSPAEAQTAVPQGGYVDLVQQVAPAVVYIEVTQRMAPAGVHTPDMPQGFPFDQFMHRFGMPGTPDGGMREMHGVGTGFIISADGQVVTNAHVVDGADTVTVTLADGRKVEGKVVGTDPATDIALIRIDGGGDLPTVAFGDSAQLKVGQDVVAIGNPFGLGNSVTSGIVSALGRDINSGPFDNYIQTDAAINKGNSGGPLFNAAGEVVGINTAIFSPSGGSVGIGFAVPSETAARVVADLADDGTVTRGWLGVQIQPVSEDIAAALGLDSARGVLISAVSADTPAAQAGLTRGDIVLAVDGAAVDDPRDLTRIIATDAPGSEVTLSLLRGGKPVDATVTLGTRPDDPA
ncbi:Do family serine endopeptidase [Maliponia aquimaris]|uniref:Putative periplasmic serine endoprotease DegP-like n=1 Tax=Maliponia aquimaris TaxID=1673631 RepID=A0A238K6T5_9RHOB|nr:Do family serine endopeptidase [Maliponia aquimaris]SMX38631.1 putative periplasmic serine endoprotease DegP-like precursor [Maliponia aquimaris]